MTRALTLVGLAVVVGLCFGRTALAQPASVGRADLHAHVLMNAALGPVYVGQPGAPPLAASPEAAWVNPIDADGLRRAGITLVVAALWIPPDLGGHTPLEQALKQLRELRAFARAASADFAIARTPHEARSIVGSGRIALVPAIEGGHAIASVDDVTALKAAGVAIVGLVHFTDNALGDARDDQLGRLSGLLLNCERGGLSRFGADVVRRMTALGMIVDISHASEQTSMDVLDIAEAEGTVVIASHEGSAHATIRSLSPRVASRISRIGGLIGIGVYRNPIAEPVPRAEQWSDFQAESCDDVLAHWRHFARVASAEALVLGSDLGAPVARPRAGRGCPRGIGDAGDLSDLFRYLIASGVSASLLDASAERVLRLWSGAEARSAHATPQR